MQIMGLPAKAIIVALIGGGFAIMGNMLALIIIGEINQKVSEGQRISYFWWGTGIRKQHRWLYPDSKLVLLFDTCWISLVLCFPILLWSLGILRR